MKTYTLQEVQALLNKTMNNSLDTTKVDIASTSSMDTALHTKGFNTYCVIDGIKISCPNNAKSRTVKFRAFNSDNNLFDLETDYPSIPFSDHEQAIGYIKSCAKTGRILPVNKPDEAISKQNADSSKLRSSKVADSKQVARNQITFVYVILSDDIYVTRSETTYHAICDRLDEKSIGYDSQYLEVLD